jgi:hypothetical protein
MNPRSPDAQDYRFLTTSEAAVAVRLEHNCDRPMLLILGNRAGLLSLANVLLWFVGNAWRREFLSLAELPFVSVEAPLSAILRLTLGDATRQNGVLVFLDRGEQLEWAIAEADLQRVAIALHSLVSAPHREYFTLLVGDGSAADVEFRMTDALEWIQRGCA